VTAHDILEEEMQVLVLKAQRDLLSRALEKDFYAIVADESSDASKKKQLPSCVRTCNDCCFEISEDFIGVYEYLEGLSPDALLKYLKDILLTCCLDGKKMAAMAFDGAAVMKSLGKKLGADVVPNAIYCMYIVSPTATS